MAGRRALAVGNRWAVGSFSAAPLIEKNGQRVVFVPVIIRNQEELDAVGVAGVAEFGCIDIVCANAGIVGFGKSWEDISSAVVYLASDGSRYVTGVALPIDGGLLIE